ncbi:hypothetical protein COLO4_20363 [Corchorus olitorius]|uniref:Uncharacterized protein n=1 Tax=Corchorus olitorius TaxID=93759 RepID=A0A1R3J048_9ROSI|nr:hypothetical protein COLO4_20363 [Corchorus olitorius]
MASRNTFSQLLFILFLCYHLQILEAAGVNSSSAGCIKMEREALLKFKDDLIDPFGRLSSWVGKDCCNWAGVACDNQTGNVYVLDLATIYNCSQTGGSSTSPYSYCKLGGSVNLSKVSTNWLEAINMLPSLLQLDMSFCEVSSLPQPLPVVNFTSLQALDLSNNKFSSPIPQWLFNISTLEQLNLASSTSTFNVTGPNPIPKVLSGNLCKLRELDMSFNYFEGEVTDFVEALSRCSNRSLETLDLTYNKLTGNLPDSLWLLTNLKSLKLSHNKFKGRLSDSLGSLRNLEELDLSHNILSGLLPMSIGNLSRLAVLDLSFNMMSGLITEGIGQLTKLFILNLYGNSNFQGVITEIHLQNLTKLFDLYISSVNKSLAFSLRQDWIPPFSLFDLAISDCQLGPYFPTWLRTQNRSSQITLSNVGISDNIPDWLWTLSPGIYWLDLSHNQLRGKLPDSIRFPSFIGGWIDLGFNNLEGSIPLWPNVTNLSLRNNLLSGPIPSNIGHGMSVLQKLDLSGNLLNGSIPSSIINNMRNLSFLDLSSNYLSGPIPRQWNGLKLLMTVDLSKNNLSGTIPQSIVAYPDSVYLLNLRANKLTGTIPYQVCRLQNLNILDLAHNNLSGPIPTCLARILRLRYPRRYFFQSPPTTREASFFEHTELVIKGKKTEFTKIIILVNTIDLSGNNLVGEIPEQITNLSALGSLNLSWNQLTGSIPGNIGSLQWLEALDLSHNYLSGPIPPSISSMTLLNLLNLSYNNLSGHIPSSNQLQTVAGPSSYEGNPGLCGPPLLNNCSSSSDGNGVSKDKGGDEDEETSQTLWVYISTALGFVVGFWAVFGTLVVKKCVRHAYFKYLDEIADKIAVQIVVNVAHLKRKMGFERI